MSKGREFKPLTVAAWGVVILWLAFVLASPIFGPGDIPNY